MLDHNHLSKLMPGFEVLNTQQVSNKDVPVIWKKLNETSGFSERKKIIIEQWRKYFPNEELSLTIAVMEHHLVELNFVTSDFGLSLLYTFDVNSRIIYREGRNPVTGKQHESALALKDKYPPQIKSFYSEFHDGWFEAGTEFMGLLPSESLRTIGDDEWGILDDISVNFDINNVVRFFSNGGGGYLCFDFNTSPSRGIIWWHNEKPTLDLVFFDVLDEWILAGLTE